MDNDLILPETDVDDVVDTTPPAKKPKTFIFIILAAIAFIGLAVALVVVILDKNSEPDQPPAEDTSEDLQKYNDKYFDEAMNKAEERLGVKDYVAAEYYLKEYSATEYMTPSQKYRYYSLYATMYSENYRNDRRLESAYNEAANEALKQIHKGEE